MDKKLEPLPDAISKMFPFKFEKAAEIKVPEVRLMIDALPSGGLRLNYTTGFLDELTAIAQANGGMGYDKPEQPCEVVLEHGWACQPDCDCKRKKGTGKKGGV